MSDNKFAEKFPETGWLCPYCMTEESDQEKCMVDRKDIPTHLVFKHEWNPGDNFSWEYIFNRLSAVGGV